MFKILESSEIDNFNRYWKVGFKYLFIVFFIIVTSRLILLYANDDTNSVSVYSVLLGYVIALTGSLFLALSVALMAIFKERT